MFNNLPTDPVILLSVINTKLRDRYNSLRELCDDLNADPEQIKARLATIGYAYDPALNKFV